MRRTPMKRTAWPRNFMKPSKAEELAVSDAPLDCAYGGTGWLKVSNGAITRINPHEVVQPIPKTEAHRNPALLEMARGRHCLLRVPGVCRGGTETTVAAHSNWACHGGKGGARKADDEYSVWGCFGCHHWLDQIAAPKATKQTAFMRAHADQVLEWRRIAQDPSEKPRYRLAAQWALDQLNATPMSLEKEIE